MRQRWRLSCPIARVAVDISLPHLDRLFDYAVTEQQSATALPGVRVRVRFAGQLVDGFVVDRVASSDHGGRLARLSSVVSAEQVLTPEIAALARPSPTGTPGRWRTSCGWPSLLATPPSSGKSRPGGAGCRRSTGATCGRRGRTGAWQPYRNGPGMLAGAG